MPTALITGGSMGLGHELVGALVERGWEVITDARDAVRLFDAAERLTARGPGTVQPIIGDVTGERHRQALVAAMGSKGLDLLVNNASTLGASPLPPIDELTPSVLRRTFDVNVIAPVALTRACLPAIAKADGVVMNITSDAALECYPGWGGYGASKAALDQLTAILAVEHPDRSVYAVDPGDLRTAMHQDAFPGEDISDRPLPASAVPGLLHLLDARPPSGRYRLADLPVGAGA